MSLTNPIGERLLSLRKERKISQRELARIADISPNSVSLIERGKISPTVATLQNIAMAFGVKIGYFFEERDNRSIVHGNLNDLPRLTSQGVDIASVGQHLRAQEMEHFFVALEPGSGSGERQVIHPGHEFVFCHQGRLDYTIDNKTYTLAAGDFLLFEASLPHTWFNSYDQIANFLLVLQSPETTHSPVRQHFSEYPSIRHV